MHRGCEGSATQDVGTAFVNSVAGSLRSQGEIRQAARLLRSNGCQDQTGRGGRAPRIVRHVSRVMYHMSAAALKSGNNSTLRRILIVEERHRIGNCCAAGAVAVGLVGAVRIAERDAADHTAVVGKAKMRSHHVGVEGERSLRDGGNAERLRREHEARDITAAIDGTVYTERLIGVHDGYMRGTEEVEILQR